MTDDIEARLRSLEVDFAVISANTQAIRDSQARLEQTIKAEMKRTQEREDAQRSLGWKILMALFAVTAGPIAAWFIQGRLS